MYLLEQGSAPAVRTKTYRSKSIELFRFVGRWLKTDDEDMVNAAVKAGAVIKEAPEPVVEKEAPKSDDEKKDEE
jgi:hypothetical protein